MKLRTLLLVLMLLLAALSACAPISSAPAADSAAAEEIAEHGDHEHGGMSEEFGDVTFTVSCTPEAQDAFNHSMAVLHSFEYTTAIDEFNKVLELDPNCVMAHWGIAMSLVEPLWAPPTSQDLSDGWKEVEAARATGIQTPREQAYIDAIAAFYQDADTVDHRTRSLAYEEAMAQLVQEYPDDTEAQIFYALALLQTALPTDKSYANQIKAVDILEPLFAEQPNHPGLAHYIIHSNDYPALAADAHEAALRYADIAPAASHALHMPSHIFTRLGEWQDSIDTNINSANAAKAMLPADATETLLNDGALHAMDYMVYGYLQLAQDQAAKAVLDEIAATERVTSESLASAYALAAIPARYVLERGEWADAASLALHPAEFPWDRFPQAEAILVFARGLGAARAGDAEAASQDLARLNELHEATVAIQQDYWASQVAIQIKELEAWIALAEGQQEDALALMQEAVDMASATEKHPVTPGHVVPAHELMGEMLLLTEQPAEAFTHFESSLVTEPNRFRSLYGAARAAELAGETETASNYYEALVALAANADGERVEVTEAEAFLAQ
jgi:tetratricopeptide (TPR) repeat protein